MSEKEQNLNSTQPNSGSRRDFLIKAGIGVVGLGLIPASLPRIVLSNPATYPLGWGSFFKGLAKFAKKVGMGFLGVNGQEDPVARLAFLEARVRQEVQTSLARLYNMGYGINNYDSQETLARGGPSMFMPLVHPQRLQNGQARTAIATPFYDVTPNPLSRLGSILTTPSMAAMPSVIDDLEQKGFGATDDLFNLLIPAVPRDNSYDINSPKDTYLSHGGAVELNYHPTNELAGDLQVRVFKKRNDRTERLMPVHEDTYGVEFGA